MIGTMRSRRPALAPDAHLFGVEGGRGSRGRCRRDDEGPAFAGADKHTLSHRCRSGDCRSVVIYKEWVRPLPRRPKRAGGSSFTLLASVCATSFKGK